MSKAKVQQEIESIKQKTTSNPTFRCGSFTDEERQILHEAEELLYRLRNEEGRVKDHPTNPEIVLVAVTADQEKLLDQTLAILEG